MREAYGIGADEIASGIQNISDAFRTGVSRAAGRFAERMDDISQTVRETGQPLEATLGHLQAENSPVTAEMTNIIRDMFFGGVCNLTRHSQLPKLLLEDLSYEPGQNDRFYAEGQFSGTPMRTLPGRIKPGIRLGDEYYATDGQLVRDSAYRAIQWGLWRRLPYRDEWLMRQGRMAEQALPVILAEQLKGAESFDNVFYRDVQSCEWVETDLLVVLADALFVVEAKAGVMPMQSPATNFASHERVINGLIGEAYRQCKRFLDYLASAPEVTLYHHIDGEYVEVGRIRQSQFRLALPIGLTIEAFTPFSAMAKELPAVEPILGKHPFISMSVDDIFVLRRILLTTGELLHYLEVRQHVAGLKGALLFDETDHLGSYISKNRFDMDIREFQKEADLVTWDGFSEKVDRHFEREDWKTAPPPSQLFPRTLRALFAALNKFRPAGWLRLDSLLRDFGQESRDEIEKQFCALVPTLAQYPNRRLIIGGESPLQFCLFREGSAPDYKEVERHAQVGCLIFGASKINIFLIGYDKQSNISETRCETCRAPSVLQRNYAVFLAEAERQRARAIALN